MQWLGTSSIVGFGTIEDFGGSAAFSSPSNGITAQVGMFAVLTQ